MNNYFEIGNARDYDRWYDEHSAIFAAEVAALNKCLEGFSGRGLEIGVRTGRFASALGIRFGVDPSPVMLRLAAKRHLTVCRGFGERLPFPSETFDNVLMVTDLCFALNREKVLAEAHRILKPEGIIAIGIGFMDRSSLEGCIQKENRPFYQKASFFSAEEMMDLLHRTGFEPIRFRQTLFDTSPEDSIQVKEGVGEGGFAAISARKIIR